MKPPIERDPESLFIFFAALALLLVLAGIGAATSDPAPTTPPVPTNTEEIK